MEPLPHILQLSPRLIHQCLMPPPANRISPIEKPARHLLWALPSPMRCHLLRLHVFEPSLLEILLDLLRSRPFWARDQRRFEARVQFLARFGPRNRDAWVDWVGPGVHAYDAPGGDDAVEFLDARCGVVGEIDVGTGEGMGDAA